MRPLARLLLVAALIAPHDALALDPTKVPPVTLGIGSTGDATSLGVTSNGSTQTLGAMLGAVQGNASTIASEVARAKSAEGLLAPLTAAQANAAAIASEASRAVAAERLLAPQASPTFSGVVTAPSWVLTGPGSTGDATLFSAVPTGATASRSLADLTASGMYDATADILKARLAPGFNGDDAPALNNVLLRERAVALHPVQPSSVLILNLKSTVKMYMANQRLTGFGGLQAVQFNHDLTNTGDTVQAGDPNDATKGAGSVHVEGIWFTHAGRLGYTSGPLQNMLTGGQSHLRVSGGQHSYIKVGGYGMPYLITINGGASTNIDSPFTYGGVWNPNDPTAQEGIAQIQFVSSPIHGHGTSGYVRNFTMYGGNVSPTQTYTVGAKQYTSTRRYGPQYGILVRSLEDGVIETGILAGFSHSAIALISDKAASGLNYITNISISKLNIDESNENGIYMTRSTADAVMISGVDIHDNTFNGQAIGKFGLNVDGSTGQNAVTKLTEHHNVYRSYLATPVKLTGVDGGQSDHNRIAGYNLAGNDTSQGGGVDFTSGRFLGGLTRNVQTTSDVYGGGQNLDVEPNSCQWGYYDATSTASGNTYSRLRLAFDGVQSGISALGLASGGLVSGVTPRDASTNYAPTVAASSGAISSYSVQGAAYTIDQGTRWVTAKVQVLVSNNGTGAGYLTFTLPFPAAGGTGNAGAGLVVGGKSLAIFVSGGSTAAQVFDYTGSYPAANNNTMVMQIRYEAAL